MKLWKINARENFEQKCMKFSTFKILNKIVRKKSELENSNSPENSERLFLIFGHFYYQIHFLSVTRYGYEVIIYHTFLSVFGN